MLIKGRPDAQARRGKGIGGVGVLPAAIDELGPDADLEVREHQVDRRTARRSDLVDGVVVGTLPCQLGKVHLDLVHHVTRDHLPDMVDPLGAVGILRDDASLRNEEVDLGVVEHKGCELHGNSFDWWVALADPGANLLLSFVATL